MTSDHVNADICADIPSKGTVNRWHSGRHACPIFTHLDMCELVLCFPTCSDGDQWQKPSDTSQKYRGCLWPVNKASDGRGDGQLVKWLLTSMRTLAVVMGKERKKKKASQIQPCSPVVPALGWQMQDDLLGLRASQHSQNLFQKLQYPK